MPADDPVFNQEQEHLADTYAKLLAIKADEARKMAQIRREAAEDKVSMSDEVAIDFDTALEMYAEYQAINQVIESHNLSYGIHAERLSKAIQLLDQPYFAKVTLKFPNRPEPRDIYIGNAGMTDDMHRHFVVDWRSPVAETYYNRDNGPTSYKANGRTIHTELLLRRQFDVERDTLNAYFDTTVAIEDPLLLASLKAHRSSQMQAITATIQREQNEVVRHDDTPALLVNGIAGSGKTSVLMQRIAYLLYRERETLRADDVFLITPNPVFQRYIDNVLPQLGERNPQTLTWQQLCAQLGVADRGVAHDELSADELLAFGRALEDFEFEPADFKPIVLRDGSQATTLRQIQNANERMRRIPAGPRRVFALEEELFDRMEGRMKGLAKNERMQEAMMALSNAEKVRLFGEASDPVTEEETVHRTSVYLDDLYRSGFADLESCAWLNIDRIGRRLLGRSELSTAEWVFTKCLVTGKTNGSARFVMIDEVQDYTEAQLVAIARFFPAAHFMLLGDENQAVKPGTADFDDVARIFSATHGQVDECRLMTSYRSSPEITALFSRLLGHDQRIEVKSVQRPGTEPLVRACESDNELADVVRSLCEQAAEEPGLCAVICRDGKSLKQVRRLLGDDAPPTIHDTDTLPEQGAVMLQLPLAKGLEFDRVVIPDADAERYPADDLSRRRLYTAISRATKQVAVLSSGPLSPWLSE